MIDEIMENLVEEVRATLESLGVDLARIRAGRAAPSLLDTVMVNYYGTQTALIKLATVSAPDARMLMVQPFDQTALPDIEKAIRTSDLGLSPVSDGKMIRLPMPELTEDRRRDLVRQVRKECEKHKISARNHRRDANEMLKQAMTDKEISEDEMHSSQADVQKHTDACVKQIESTVKAKETEVMAV